MISHTHSESSHSRNGDNANYIVEDKKDFLYYFYILLRNWYWLVLGLIAGASLFYYQMRYSVKQYKITGSVLIEDPSEKSVSKEAITREFGLEKGGSRMWKTGLRYWVPLK